MKKRYKIPLLTILGIIFLVLVFVLVIGNTKILENQANYVINFLLVKDYPIKVRIDDIRGNLLGNLSLHNVSLEYTEPNQEYRVVHIDELKLSYNLFDLRERKWIFNLLEIYNPKIIVRKSKEGKLLLPVPTASKTIAKSGLFNYKVKDIRIIGGEIKFPSKEKEEKIDIYNLRLSLNHQGEETQIEILQGGLCSPLRDFVIKNLEGKLKLGKNSLAVENFHLLTPQSDIKLKGKISDLKEFDFSFDLDIPEFDFEELNQLFGTKLSGKIGARGICFGNLQKFEGEMFLDGKFFERDFDSITTKYLYADKILTFEDIKGKVFKSPIYANGLIDFQFKPEEYQLWAEVGHLDINNIVEIPFHTNLTGRVNLFGQSFSDKELIMDIQTDLGWSKIDQYSFDQLKGDFLVTASDIYFLRGFWGRYKNTWFELSGEIEYNNLIDIETEVFFNDLTDFEYQTFLGKIAGQGNLELKIFGRTEDFDLKGNFISDSAWVYDLFSRDLKVDFEVDKYFTQKDGKLDIRLLEGSAWGVPYDSITGFVTLKGENLVIIDSAFFKNEYSILKTSGNYNQSLFVPALFLDRLELVYRDNQIKSTQPLHVDIGEDLIRLEASEFVADGGIFQLSGRMEKDSLNLKATFENIDINPWFRVFLPEKKIEGRLTGDFLAWGFLESPQMELVGEIKQTRFEEIDFGNVSAWLKYKSDLLEIDTLSIFGEHGDYGFSGFMPLNLSLVNVGQRFPQKEQNIRARFEGKSIIILPYFVPDLEYLNGDFEGNLSITGTPLKPYFDGQMNIRNGTLKLEKLVDPVENLEAQMDMKGTKIDFKRIEGIVKHKVSPSDNFLKRMWHSVFPRKSKQGQVGIWGSLDVKNIDCFLYDFTLQGKDLPIRYEYADLSAVVDADLEIKGLSPPLVSGDIEPLQLYYREPFGASEGQLSGIGDTTLWDLNLNISADDQIFVMNYDMNAEWKGNLVISREKGKYTLLGEMEAIRGKYSLAKSFNIDQGKMTFDNIERIDPKLDFLLSTTVYSGPRYPPGLTDTLSFSEYNDIELHVGGTLLSPEVGPVAGSPYSREDIIQLLAIGYSPSSQDTTFGRTPFEQRFLNSLGGTIGALGSRALEDWATNTIGLETFEIRPEQRGRFSLWSPEVTVGKYFANRVYIRYTFGPAQAQDKRWSMEYRLSKHFLMEASRDREDRFHLGFNLSWDF